MARPKKEEQDTRTERLNLRLTPDERAEVDAKAAAVGVSPTDYARRLALGGRLARITRSVSDPVLVLALNRLGVNLNQIARSLNNSGGVSPAELSATLARLNALLDQLQEVFSESQCCTER